MIIWKGAKESAPMANSPGRYAHFVRRTNTRSFVQCSVCFFFITNMIVFPQKGKKQLRSETMHAQ